MSYEKKKRIRSPKTIKKVRENAKGFCEHCGIYKPPLHVHHIKSKGSGGGDTEDNLIALCFICHDRIHKAKIPKETLIKIAEGRSNEN